MKFCLVVVGLVVVRSTIGVPSLSWHSRTEFDVRCMKTSQFKGSRGKQLATPMSSQPPPGGAPAEKIFYEGVLNADILRTLQ